MDQVRSKLKSGKKVRTALDREVDQELISKGKDVLKDFDESQALYVPAKRRKEPIGTGRQMGSADELLSYAQVMGISKAMAIQTHGCKTTGAAGNCAGVGPRAGGVV